MKEPGTSCLDDFRAKYSYSSFVSVSIECNNISHVKIILANLTN